MFYAKYGGMGVNATPQLGINGLCQGPNLKKFELFKVGEL